MILWELFLSFLQVGMFSIGGGYAAMPLIQSEVVDKHAWISMSEFTDLITIAEMTPGPIAINSATFVGIQVAGPIGALIATLACILPSLFIVSLLSYIYYKYKEVKVIKHVLATLRPAVIALIASAGISILLLVVLGEHMTEQVQVNVVGLVLFLSSIALLRFTKINPILVLLLCGITNLIIGNFFGFI